MKYNWQQPDWPKFIYDSSVVDGVLLAIAERMGRISGLLEGLPENLKVDTVIELMVVEAIKTSEIEGEHLKREDVVSSIRNNLGLHRVKVADKRAQGAAQLMLDVRDTFDRKLTQNKLFQWHRLLMKGNNRVKCGAWRTHREAMQVISGPAGKEKIHFEAPPSDRIPSEMKHFLTWFNETGPGGRRVMQQPVIRSAIAHLYFESIHPFEDGNGRIGRALSEKALSQGIGRPVMLSLSRTIEANKKAYYQSLQTAQRANEVTPWLEYFANTVLAAQIEAEEQIGFTLKKAKFFDRYQEAMNARQKRVVQRMLDEGPGGFEGGMSAKKYIAITHTSKATATRDLTDLVSLGVFNPVGAGRSARYRLNI